MAEREAGAERAVKRRLRRVLERWMSEEVGRGNLERWVEKGKRRRFS
jgi:hypothetical protein